MNTLHFVSEWFDCGISPAWLADAEAVQARCQAQLACRSHPVTYAHFTRSHLDGVIGAITSEVLHIVVRTYPQRQAVVADLYVDHQNAHDAAIAMQVLGGLRDDFRPRRALLHRVHRDDGTTQPGSRSPRAPTEVFSVPPPRAQRPTAESRAHAPGDVSAATSVSRSFDHLSRQDRALRSKAIP